MLLCISFGVSLVCDFRLLFVWISFGFRLFFVGVLLSLCWFYDGMLLVLCGLYAVFDLFRYMFGLGWIHTGLISCL